MDFELVKKELNELIKKELDQLREKARKEEKKRKFNFELGIIGKEELIYMLEKCGYTYLEDFTFNDSGAEIGILAKEKAMCKEDIFKFIEKLNENFPEQKFEIDTIECDDYVIKVFKAIVFYNEKHTIGGNISFDSTGTCNYNLSCSRKELTFTITIY